MLIALALITLAMSLLIVVLLGFLRAGIRTEDRGSDLGCRPPTLITALTRRVLGLHVRRPVTPCSIGDSCPDSALAVRRTTSHSGGDAS